MYVSFGFAYYNPHYPLMCFFFNTDIGFIVNV